MIYQLINFNQNPLQTSLSADPSTNSSLHYTAPTLHKLAHMLHKHAHTQHKYAHTLHKFAQALYYLFLELDEPDPLSAPKGLLHPLSMGVSEDDLGKGRAADDAEEGFHAVLV